MSDSPRKTGSVVLAATIGVTLLVLGFWILRFGDLNLKDYSAPVNIGTCILFGIVLLWWAVSANKEWGIGFETITMVVTVVTAVIAILTLTRL